MARDLPPDSGSRRLSARRLLIGAVTLLAGLAVAHTAGIVAVPLLPDTETADRAPSAWTVEPDTGSGSPGNDGASIPDDPLAPGSTESPSGVDDGPDGDSASGSAPGPLPGPGDNATNTAPYGRDPPISLGPAYYVDNAHPNASDSNQGTSQAAPWRTIVHGAATVRAGETLYVKAGTYDDGPIEVEHSGAPGAPIVIAAYPGQERQAVVVNAGFMSVGNSHIELRGFTVRHSPDTGIRFMGPTDPYAPPATDIVIADNHTYDTCSSGISIWGVEWLEDPGDYDNIRNVVIEDNLLELGTNGCKNEIITVANGAVNVDVRRNTIRLGDPTMRDGDEGIDFKEGVRDSRIHHNTIYDLSEKAIYIDGGRGPQHPVVSNISIYSNHMYDLPSAGVSIVSEGTGVVDGVYVFNNVVHDVLGDAFLVYRHPRELSGGGTVRNVHIVNNTAYNAGMIDSGHGGIRVNHPTATGIVIRNNIAWNNNGYDIRGEDETTIDHNLCREAELCETSGDPNFVDVAGRNLHLRGDSPAIDVGATALAPGDDKDGRLRPKGAGIDLGAYEPA